MTQLVHAVAHPNFGILCDIGNFLVWIRTGFGRDGRSVTNALHCKDLSMSMLTAAGEYFSTSERNWPIGTYLNYAVPGSNALISWAPRYDG